MLQESNHSRAVRRRLPIAAVLCLALVFAIVPSIALAGPLGDSTAPISSSDVEAAYVEPAVIHITAVDPPDPLGLDLVISGVKSITYVLNGGTPVVVLGASATVTVTEPGHHTLSFFAEDNDLNIETAIDASFDIEPYDLFPPVTVSDVEAAYLDSGVITLTATDDVGGFGVDATYWILDSAPAAEGTTIAFDEFGHHTLSFWSTDLAGNIEVAIETFFYVFDTLPPVTSSNAVPSYVDAAVITLSPSDGNGSGVVDTWYILDDGAAVKGTSVTVSALGDHTLDFWSVDAEGNAEAMKSVDFSIGVTADPTAPVSISDAQASYPTSPATIKLTTTDEEGGSGIKSLSYKVDGGTTVVVLPPAGPPAPGTLINPITPTVPAPASHHNLGACTGCHTSGCATCHGVGPAPDLTTADPKPASHAFITVTPCTACHVVNPASTPMSIMKDVVVSGLGAHTIEFWGEDVAGNIETPHKMVDFTIGAADTVAPVITITGVANAATYTEPVTITFSALDAVDGPVAASATLDGAAFTSGSAVSEPGDYTLVVTAEDAAGNPATRTINFTISEPSEELDVVAVAGATRIGTAIEASKLAFPEGANYVVIATAYNWPDALGGSALAGALNAPILLTPTGTLPSEVADEIERLDASNAVILGGTGAVSGTVESALKALLGSENVDRIGGISRYDTAKLIAQETIDVLGEGYDGTAFIATGANFPDALGASPLAAANGWPIYLANPTQGNNAALVAIMEDDGVTDAILLGGTGVVADSIRLALGATYEIRLAGIDRYATAVEVATYGVSDAGLTWDKLAIATGEDFPDALAGGVLQGNSGSVMLLTHTAYLDTVVAAKLNAQAASIFEVRFLGGTGAVSTAVRTSVTNILEK